jgi:hypothetical protein
VEDFKAFLARIDGLELVLGNTGSVEDCAFTQVVLRIDEARLGCNKTTFKDGLYARGVPVWHANFEPINSLSLFRTSAWEDWLPRADLARTRVNYAAAYPAAQHAMASSGLGLGKMNFLSRQNLQHAMRQIESLARSPRTK